MAGRGFLGCVGAGVAVVAGLVVGWLTIDLALSVAGAISGYGPAGPLRDPIVWHQVGQILVFTVLIWAILGLVLRPERVGPWLPPMRILLWTGAALELAAWIGLPSGSRMGTWALMMALMAIPGPWVIARAARETAPPAAS